MQFIYSLYLYSRAFIFSLIFMPIAILCSLIAPSSIYRVGQFISKGIFKCFQIPYKIEGKIPQNGPFIMMHNHSSFLDLFFLPMIIPTKYTGIIAAKNFKIPIIGTILRRIKGIPIQRSNFQQAMDAIKIAERRLHEGYHICIFPEGTRTTTGKLSTFKKGGFHMAINTKTSILPIAVKGLFQIKPKNRWNIFPQQATMIIGNPITVDDKEISAIIKEMENFYINHGFSF